MALLIKSGTFTLSSSTGNQSITGVGFQGKAVLFQSIRFSAGNENATNNVMYHSLGCATSSSQRWAVGMCGAQGASSLPRQRRWRYDNRALVGHNFDAAADFAFDFVSFDTDGFTINVTTALARIVFYWVIGGDDVSNAKAGTYNVPTGTGNFSVTDPGFQPKFLLTAGGRFDTSTGVTTTAALAVGVATGPTEQGAFAVLSFTNQATVFNDVECGRVIKSDACRVRVNSTPSVIAAGSFVSFDTNGFTINRTISNVELTDCYLALGGSFVCKVGQDSQRGSTGTKTTSGLGPFQPKGLLFGWCGTINENAAANAATSLGWVDENLDQAVVASSSNNISGIGAAQMHRSSSTSTCLRRVRGTGSGAANFVIDADASIDSVGAGQFTLNWSTADSAERLFWYAAFGDDEGVPFQATAGLGEGSGEGFRPLSIPDPFVGHAGLGEGAGEGLQPLFQITFITEAGLGEGSGEGFQPAIHIGATVSAGLGEGFGEGFQTETLIAVMPTLVSLPMMTGGFGHARARPPE